MYPSSVIVTEGHEPQRPGFDEKNFDIWKIRQGQSSSKKKLC